jgi:hypothetical protein
MGLKPLPKGLKTGGFESRKAPINIAFYAFRYRSMAIFLTIVNFGLQLAVLNCDG